MRTLFILNGAPYGSELTYNGLRLAGSLSKRDGQEVRVFLMGDAVGAAVAGQVLPDGYYHLDRMLTLLHRRGARVACCGTCMDARAVEAGRLVEGAHRSTLEELTDWTIWSDTVVTF
jgi:uncharacterized protein involved in oxidation of intracellular sulfur